MSSQNHIARQGPMVAEHPLVITRAEAEAGAQRTLRFNGPDGRERNYVVTIPPGVVTGARLQIESDDWACGSLAIMITVVPHQRYECRGDDLYLTLQVDRAAALREGTLQVPIGGGKVIAVPVPSGTSHSRFVYAGQGLPRAHDARRAGDLIVRLELLDAGETAIGASAIRAEPAARKWWQSLFGT
jgi:curved DNA-binding protein